MVNVLVVDDDPNMRMLLRVVLHYDGHTIQEASDGVEGLACIQDSQVSLVVLLDWQMPRLDGFGVLRAVAANPALAALHRFVLVTATDLAQDQERLALLEDLRVPVIQKPFDIAAISQAVECAAGGYVAAI